MSQSTKTKKPEPQVSESATAADSVYRPQATVSEINVRQKVIKDAKEIDAGLFGHLWIGDRQVLVIRGSNDFTQVAFTCYNRFAQEVDISGAPFKYSSRYRGLSHVVDLTWRLPSKISGEQFSQYCRNWFTPCQMISTTGVGQALLILDKFPPLSTAQLLQPRYSGLFRDLFESLD
jgi:hypothetical protein